MGKFFIVDVEARGPCPTLGNMTEIGIVYFHDWTKTFHGVFKPVWPVDADEPFNDPAKRERMKSAEDSKVVMERLAAWLKATMPPGERPILVSDNPAYDAMWVFTYSHLFLGDSPFGHSGRRIGDLYAGAVGDLRRPWKHLRETKHTHHPVDDAMGNAEALAKVLDLVHVRLGERKQQEVDS